MFQLHPQLAADTFVLGDLPLCRVLLVNDSQYPWLILVPRRVAIEEIYQLQQPERQQLDLESSTTAKILMEHFNGDKFNIAALGNMVPQLHVHHIVRFKSDPAWPKPVWGALPAIPYREQSLLEQVRKISTLLASQLEFKAC